MTYFRMTWQQSERLKQVGEAIFSYGQVEHTQVLPAQDTQHAIKIIHAAYPHAKNVSASPISLD